MVQESHLVLNMGDWWMESHTESGVSTAGGAIYAAVFNLLKPGRFVGVGACINGNISNASGVLVVKGDGSRLAYGDAIDDIRINITNETAGPLDVGVHFIVFLKR